MYRLNANEQFKFMCTVDSRMPYMSERLRNTLLSANREQVACP